MKKLAALLLLVPAIALAAAPTWSSTVTGYGASSQAVCGSGTCSDTPTGTTPGSPIGDSSGLTVFVCADANQTLSAAGNLRAYVYDDIGGLWARVPDLDLAVTAATGTYRCQSWPGLYVPGNRGRVAWVPDGVTVSSGGVTIRINVNAKNGAPI